MFQKYKCIFSHTDIVSTYFSLDRKEYIERQYIDILEDANTYTETYTSVRARTQFYVTNNIMQDCSARQQYSRTSAFMNV